ncbi:MAG: phosphoribosylglycinamide formyltransferase [Arenimonas sp.]|uniref:phosphoribosylglycinamide formyltransferase n=1 Tax=Arenimonas sp. TaxID=1872635 RepID=UPI0025B9213B|nr:phosphoribosylglycinamide formyltransferase [Arenimonas sp.]MBW8367417.1 phosphoribosylglycinamide formyltransferase [Arenimonas sp.]
MTLPPLRIAVLASGRGSNLQALLDAIGTGVLEARIVGVFSDKPASGAIALAGARGLHGVAIRPRDCPDRAAHDEALFSEIAAVQPDLIVFAGYMRIVGAAALSRLEGRMINIHPSLLPKYPGLDTHARALAAGDAEHGASVHAVTPALDAGPLLAQVRIPLLPGDDAPALAARLLPREHALLVATATLFAQRRVRLHADHAELDGRRLAAPLQLDAANHLIGA